MNKRITLVVVLASMLALTGCNTVAGFGKDLEKVGEQMQDKSKK